MLSLRPLRLSDEESFSKALQAKWDDGFIFFHYLESISNNSFFKYVADVPRFSKGELIPKEHVPCTLLFAFDEDENLVGRVSIRHELTPFLLKEGGHIGYGVLPGYRKKGHATEILRLSLKYMQANLPSISKALVTCNEGNIASQKTIEKNSGKLENIEGGKRRYWIDVVRKC